MKVTVRKRVCRETYDGTVLAIYSQEYLPSARDRDILDLLPVSSEWFMRLDSQGYALATREELMRVEEFYTYEDRWYETLWKKIKEWWQ